METELNSKYCVRNSKKGKRGIVELARAIPDAANKTMVEIGSYAGESTLVFANHFKFVHTVDPWLNDYDDSTTSTTHPMEIIEGQFDLRMKDKDNFQKLKMTSVEAEKLFEDESLDFVYIDGCHSYEAIKEDIGLWMPKVKTGCHLAGHDYYKRFPGAIKIVDETFGTDFELFADTSWLVVKK